MSEPTPDPTPAPEAAAAAPALPDELFQIVRAWQHRHPLARRLLPSAVGGVGLVRLPVDAQGQPAFKPQRLVAGVGARALKRLCQRDAFEHRPGPEHWPVREVAAADPAAATDARWLITVALDNGRFAPCRVLIGATRTDAKGRSRTPVAGRRPLAWIRVGLALAGLTLLLGGGLAAVLLWPSGTPAPVAVAASAPPAEAASAPEPAVAAASEAASAEAPEAEASASAAVVADTAEPAASAAPPHEAASAPAASRSWALVSAPTWRKAELEAARKRLPEVLGPQVRQLNVELMHTPQGWVLTLWPLADAEQAERLAASLRRQGLAMLLVDF